MTVTESQPVPGADVIPELADYPPALDTAQVAEVLGIADSGWVSSQLFNKRWPGFRVGRDWRMRRSVVQRIMLGQDPFGSADAADAEVGDESQG